MTSTAKDRPTRLPFVANHPIFALWIATVVSNQIKTTPNLYRQQHPPTLRKKGNTLYWRWCVSKANPIWKGPGFPSWKERSLSHLTRSASMAGSFVNGKDSFDHFMQKRRGCVYEAYVPGLNYKTRNFFLPFDVYITQQNKGLTNK